MTVGAGAGAAGGAAVAAAIANAIKASGAIVQVEPKDFQTLLNKSEAPLVVYATSRFFSTTHKYLMSYKGLAFFTKSAGLLSLPSRVEVVHAKKIWIPG